MDATSSSWSSAEENFDRNATNKLNSISLYKLEVLLTFKVANRQTSKSLHFGLEILTGQTSCLRPEAQVYLWWVNGLQINVGSSSNHYALENYVN